MENKKKKEKNDKVFMKSSHLESSGFDLSLEFEKCTEEPEHLLVVVSENVSRVSC